MNYAPGSSVIPFDDTSRTSRVTATIAHTIDNSVDSIYSSVFDEFFMLFDELGRVVPQNSMIVFLQVFISFYQYFISTFLPFLPGKWDFSKLPDKALRYLTYPIDFGLGDTNILLNGIPSYFILIFDFLILLYLSVIFIYHHFTKMLPKHHARIIRFILSFVIPIMLSPSCYNIGFSFNYIFKSENQPILTETNSTNTNQTYIVQPITGPLENNRTYFISSTFFGIIFYLFLLAIFYVDLMFRSSTPYIENTPLSMWDGIPLFLCIFGCSITNLSSRLIERLPNWSGCFLVVCCIFYNAFILYKMFYFPMIKQWMNVFISIFIGTGFFASFFQLLPISSLLRIIIPLCFFVVLIPVFVISFRILRKKIAKHDITNETIKKEGSALRYLRIFIRYNCEEFISFNWIRLMNHLDTPKIISQVTQIISFFPSESHNLTFYISFLSKNHQLNFYQRYLLFQVRQVHILRQSSTSSGQLNEDLYEISKVTNKAINSFSQFLIRIVDERRDLSLDGLNFLSKVNRETNSICHEAMARYPNNSRLLFIYSRFVIECHADFKTGVSLFHEGQMIDRGKRTSIDLAFQCMANLFPMYLWKRILNYKGQIILHRKRSKSGSSMSVDSISNDKDKNADQDIESNDKIASGVIESPRLRFALRKSVNNMNSVGIPFLTMSAIIRFLLGAIMFIVLMFVVPDLLQQRAINYSSIAQINIFRKNLDLCLFRTAKLWSWSLGLAPRQENITDYLDEGITIEDYNNLTKSPYEELFTKVVESVKSNEDLGKLLIEVKYKQSANLVGEHTDLIDKTTTDLLHVKNISFCSRKLQKVFETSTSLRYFALYILNQVSTVTNLNQVYDHPSEWKNDDCICEIILNMHNIVSVLMEQSAVLIERERIYSDTVENNLVLIIAILVPCVFVVLAIPSIVGYFITNSEFQHIFDILSLLPIKIYKDASKPIAIFQTDNDQTAETVSPVERKSCQKLTFILPAIISTLLITGGLAGTLLLYLDVNKQFYTLVKWLETGSLRTPLVIEIITHNILAGIFGFLGASDYTSHEHHLSLLMNYSRQLLLQHKSLIYGYGDLKPCYGFNDDLDDLHFTNTCYLNLKGESLRVNYRCLSLDQQIYTFHKLSKDVYFTMLNAQTASMNNSARIVEQFNQNFRNILNDYESINLHFLGITHLLPKLESAQNMLNDGVYLQIDHLKEYTYLICLLILGCAFVVFIIEMFVMNNLKEDFNIVRILIARLPPATVVKNKQLVELIVGRNSNKKSRKITPITINVQNCSNSIIIFDHEGKIQLVNSAATKLFGFTKEQLYQSDLSLIICNEDYEIIKDRCKINSRQNENQVKNETEFTSVNENETNDEILTSLLLNNDYDNIDLNMNTPSSTEKIDLYQNPFYKTIVGTKDDGMQVILSATLTYLPAPDDVFALILRDETSIYINEEDIKQAKQKANEILNNVLPAEIVENSRMKENISFSVKLLSVITIKILNFNDSIPHITSVQAIRNMTELFMMFDAQLLNYQTLTKTCVISGTYQAVGGLFNTTTIKNIDSSAPDDLNSDNITPDYVNSGYVNPDEDLIDLNNDETEIDLDSGTDIEDSRNLVRQNSILADDQPDTPRRKRRNSIVIDLEPDESHENLQLVEKNGKNQVKVKPTASSPSFSGRRRKRGIKNEIKSNASTPNVKVDQSANHSKTESDHSTNMQTSQSGNEDNENASSQNAKAEADQSKNESKSETKQDASPPAKNNETNQTEKSPDAKASKTVNESSQKEKEPSSPKAQNSQNKSENKEEPSSPKAKNAQNKNENKEEPSSPKAKNDQNKSENKEEPSSPKVQNGQNKSENKEEPSSPKTKNDQNKSENKEEPSSPTSKAEPNENSSKKDSEPKSEPNENPPKSDDKPSESLSNEKPESGSNKTEADPNAASKESQADLNSTKPDPGPSEDSPKESAKSALRVAIETGALNHISSFNSNDSSVPRINSNKSSFSQGVTSIYSTGMFSQNKVEAINDIILDSIYFAFNCLDATEYINNASGTNFVIGVGINIGGPCAAGTLGHEHMQFNVIGEAVKTSYLVCNAAEAGNILISSEAYEQLKDSSEAQRNFVFEKYKLIDLYHSKRTQTYIARASEIFRQERNMDDDDEPDQNPLIDNENDNNNENNNDNDDDDDEEGDLLDAIPSSEMTLEQQMDRPDDEM